MNRKEEEYRGRYRRLRGEEERGIEKYEKRIEEERKLRIER